MSKSCCSHWCSRFVILLTCQSVLAEDVREAWRADFDGGNLNGASNPVFINGSSKESEPDRLTFRSKEGVITLGGQFDKMDDRAELTWPKLGELSLQSSPMLEIRHKLTAPDPVIHVEVVPTYLSADGSQRDLTFYLSPRDEWQTTAQRLAADEQIPVESRPRVLVGLSIKVHCNHPAELEIDWVRLREFTAAEQQREEEWLSLVGDGPPAEPAVLREFFPFGMYDDSSDIGEHHITHRHVFDVMARHHLNYKQSAFLHIHDGSLTLGPTPKAAEQTGMRMSARVRPILHHFGREGPDAATAYIKPWIDAIADHPSVIGFDIGDERPILDFWPAAGAARVIERLDPTRFSALTFAHFAPANIQAYERYLCLYLSDAYPLGYGKDPEYLYEWCHRVAKESNNKRHWIVLQTFGDSRSRQWRSGAILPDVAQLRLMTFGSIAGGARGIIYYNFNWDRAETPADQWCNPRNNLLAEISRLGERLIPIGRRLVDAEVDFETVVKTDNEDRVIVGVLHAPKRDVHYLVVVNKNVSASESVTLELPAAWRDRKVLDLESLKDTSGTLQVPLLPGDGHVYMMGSAEQCRVEADAIRANRIEESLRVMTPDISTAKSWELDVSQVLRLREIAGKALQQEGSLDLGEQSARKAGELLETLLAAFEPYASIKLRLDRIGQRMGAVEPAMWEDNRDAEIVKSMAPFRQPYWELHARWAQGYGMLLEGQRDGLLASVEATAADSEAVLTGVRQTLDGGSIRDHSP